MKLSQGDKFAQLLMSILTGPGIKVRNMSSFKEKTQHNFTYLIQGGAHYSKWFFSNEEKPKAQWHSCKYSFRKPKNYEEDWNLKPIPFLKIVRNFYELPRLFKEVMKIRDLAGLAKIAENLLSNYFFF